MPFNSIAHQRLVVDTDFSVPVTVTAPSGKTISDFVVEGLLEGFSSSTTYNAGRTSCVLRITGKPERQLADKIWDLLATYNDASTERLKIDYTIIGKTPIITVYSRVTLYQNVKADIPVFIQNYDGDGTAEGELIGLAHEDIDEAGVRVTAMPDALVPASEDANVLVSVPDPAGGSAITANQPYRVISGTPPALTGLSFTSGAGQVTLSWTAVTNAINYAYRDAGRRDEDDAWVYMGNVTSYTIKELDNLGYAFDVRVASPWVGSYVTIHTSVGVPNIVTGLSLTSTGTTITASWTAPQQGASAITRYEFRYRTGVNWTGWTSTGDAETTYTISGLTQTTKYWVQVRAGNALGSGLGSAEATVTTKTITVPAQITNLTARPLDYGVMLEWTLSSDGNSPLHYYQVRSKRGTNSYGGWGVRYVVSDFTDYAVSSGYSYTFQIRAVNSEGTSLNSNEATVDTFFSFYSPKSLGDKTARSVVYREDTNKFYYLLNNSAQRYSAGMARETTGDLTLSSFGTLGGATWGDSHFWLKESGNNTVKVFSATGSRVSTKEFNIISPGEGKTYQAIAYVDAGLSSDYLYISTNLGTVRVYETDGDRDTSKEFQLGNFQVSAMAYDKETKILYFAKVNTRTVRAVKLDGTVIADFTFTRMPSTRRILSMAFGGETLFAYGRSSSSSNSSYYHDRIYGHIRPYGIPRIDRSFRHTSMIMNKGLSSTRNYNLYEQGDENISLTSSNVPAGMVSTLDGTGTNQRIQIKGTPTDVGRGIVTANLVGTYGTTEEKIAWYVDGRPFFTWGSAFRFEFVTYSLNLYSGIQSETSWFSALVFERNQDNSFKTTVEGDTPIQMTVTGLPTGVTGTYDDSKKEFTVSGKPTTAGIGSASVSWTNVHGTRKQSLAWFVKGGSVPGSVSLTRAVYDHSSYTWSDAQKDVEIPNSQFTYISNISYVGTLDLKALGIYGWASYQFPFRLYYFCDTYLDAEYWNYEIYNPNTYETTYHTRTGSGSARVTLTNPNGSRNYWVYWRVQN